MFKWSVIAALILAVTPGWASESTGSHWHGSPAIPLHRLQLKDERGVAVIPSASQPMPFSARESCGPCHPYDKVRAGRHFNAVDAEARKGRPTEPWILVDQRTGTVLPLSSRGTDAGYDPGKLGFSSWDFVKAFGRHMPGGGVGEEVPEGESPQDHSRWRISGGLEVNCLACHARSFRQDHSEWARQIGRENFRWAATAAAGLGDVGGMASRARETWNVFDGPNLDDRLYAVPPFVRYDRSQFDSKGRAFLDIGRPTDERCVVCHATHRVGARRMDEDQDVHTAAGLACVDCHRNGLDHDIVRGYPAETHERDDSHIASLSCRGCHLGTGGHGGSTAGRLGAPYPEHKGLPPVHLEKMTCTACHTSLEGKAAPGEVRTARANRLGIYGQAEWSTVYPRIIEPVFMRGSDGRIGPHKVMWPAFWGELHGDDVKPLLPEAITNAAAGVMDAEQAVADILAVLQVEPEVLQALAGADEPLAGVPVAVTEEGIFKRDVDGGLDPVNARTVKHSRRTPKTLAFGYLVEDRVVPLVGSPDAKTGRFYQKLEEEDEAVAESKESSLRLALAGILEKLTASPRIKGDVVVKAGQTVLGMQRTLFLPVDKTEYDRVAAETAKAAEAVTAAMAQLQIVFEEGNYYRKLDWKFKKITPSRFFRDDDLKDLQELIDQLSRAERRQARIVRYGAKCFSKYMEVAPGDVAALKHAAAAAKKAVADEMKAKGVVREGDKYYQVTEGAKARFYFMREERARNTTLHTLVLAAERAADKVASLRQQDGKTYRQAQSDDPDMQLAELPAMKASGALDGISRAVDGSVHSLLPPALVKGAMVASVGPELFSLEQVGMMLTKLGKEMPGKQVVYVAGGRLYQLDSKGALSASEHAAAGPVSWPAGHHVRPASQSLGARKCTECHSASSPFFFGKVEALGPVAGAKPVSTPMHELQDLDGNFQRLFGLSFRMRPLFKVAMIGVSGLIGCVILLYLLLALQKLIGDMGRRDAA